MIEDTTVLPVGVGVDVVVGVVDVVVGLVGENVERHLGSLLLDVLDEDRYLHGAPDLSPDCGDPGLVAKQGVHGDGVLYDQGGDGDERQDQHVQDEELLSAGSGGVDAVTANFPDSVGHSLE